MCKSWALCWLTTWSTASVGIVLTTATQVWIQLTALCCMSASSISPLISCLPSCLIIIKALKAPKYILKKNKTKPNVKANISPLPFIALLVHLSSMTGCQMSHRCVRPMFWKHRFVDEISALHVVSWIRLVRQTVTLLWFLLCLQQEGEASSDQSLKEFEGATLRYASINLKYVLWNLFSVVRCLWVGIINLIFFLSCTVSITIIATIYANLRKKRSLHHSPQT